MIIGIINQNNHNDYLVNEKYVDVILKLNDWKECLLIKKEIEELRNLCKMREL